jgi:hypothetical protein
MPKSTGPYLDAAAMDRIIAAAGAEPSHRERLRESILSAEMLYLTLDGWDKGGAPSNDPARESGSGN